MAMFPFAGDVATFETHVLDAFRECLQGFCAGRPAGRLDVVVTVVTAWPIPGLHELLHRHAARILGVELPSARLARLVLDVEEHLPEPWHHITVAAQARAGGTTPYPRSAPSADPVLALTLAYEDRHRFVFPLAAADLWLAVRRGPVGPDDRPEIPLPDHFYVVPAGPLLQLRYWDGRVELHRATIRTEYTVQVDGRTLDPGNQVLLAEQGAIAYVADGRRTALQYLLKGWK